MKKDHRFLLIQEKGQSKKLINTSNDPEALENTAQRFNEQANGCTYFVIDKLNPPLNEALHQLLGVDGWQEIYSDAPSEQDIKQEMADDTDKERKEQKP